MTQTPLPENAQVLLTWQAPVAPNHIRGPRWYFLAGTFVVACAAYGILMGEWTFTVVMVLMVGMYVLTHRTPETVKTLSITREGLVYENSFTQWRDIRDFWMLQGRNYIELHIALQNGRFIHEVIIQTGAEDPQAIRALLANFIPERTGQQERLLDIIIRICKL